MDTPSRRLVGNLNIHFVPGIFEYVIVCPSTL